MERDGLCLMSDNVFDRLNRLLEPEQSLSRWSKTIHRISFTAILWVTSETIDHTVERFFNCLTKTLENNVQNGCVNSLSIFEKWSHWNGLESPFEIDSVSSSSSPKWTMLRSWNARSLSSSTWRRKERGDIDWTFDNKRFVSMPIDGWLLPIRWCPLHHLTWHRYSGHFAPSSSDSLEYPTISSSCNTIEQQSRGWTWAFFFYLIPKYKVILSRIQDDDRQGKKIRLYRRTPQRDFGNREKRAWL